MNQAVNTVRQRLLALQDTGYQAFQAKLMPTVDPAKSSACGCRFCASWRGSWPP